MTRLHAFCAVLAATAALLAFSGTASAGTYVVSQCDARTGSALPGWTTLRRGNWKAANTCPKNLKLTAKSRGRYVALRTPVLPAELGIARVSFLASGLRTPGARPEAGFCKNAPAKKLCKRQITRRAAKGSRKAHSNEYVWHQHGNKPGARAFEVGIRATRSRASATTTYLNARHFKFTINDKTRPTLAVDASQLPATAANTTFKVTVNGSDKGGGVKGFWLDATGAADAATSRYLALTCDYTQWQPCSTSTSRSFTINTANFDNGPASLTFASEDAAGNRSAPQTFNFVVSRKTIGVVADAIAPAVAVDNSTVPTSWTRRAFNVTVSGTDADSGVRGFWLDASTSSKTTPTQYVAATCDDSATPACPGNAAASFPVDSEVFGTGALTLTFTAEDDAGNRSAPQTVVVDVDNTPPATPGAITYTDGDCYAAHLSWPYTAAAGGSPLVGLRLTFARWYWNYPADHKITTSEGATTVDLPFGNYENYGDVTLTGISDLRLPTPGSNENNYVVLLRVLDAAGNESEASLTHINSDGCPS